MKKPDKLLNTKLWIALLFITGIQWAAYSQTTLKGIVTDEITKETIIGAIVQVKGTSVGTATDVDGYYEVRVDSFPCKIVVSYIGYVTRQIDVNAAATELNITLTLKTDESEIVIVGYDTQRKEDVVGSIVKIDPEETKNIPVASFDAQLQGKAAGVQVNSQNGIPGDAVVVRIRGASTINASADPLYIIDGVFINNESMSTVDLGGKATSPLADINPADIENIEVLKDASATAIYGSRGANGVVIVTTKRGNYEQKPTLTFTTTQGAAWADKSRLWKQTTGPEHATLVNEAWINSGVDNPSLNQNYANRPFRPVSEGGRGNPEDQQTYDRISDLFRTGYLQQYDLGLQGGGKNNKYYFGASYNKQEANIRPVFYERASFKANIDSKISERISFGVSNTLSYSFRNQTRAGTGTGTGIFQSALHTPTYQPKNNPDGTPSRQSPFDNLDILLSDVFIRTASLRYIGNSYATFDLLKNKDLKFRTSFSLDYNLYDESEYNTSRTLKGAATRGFGLSNISQNTTWINEQTITYRKSIRNKHTLGVLVGNTLQSNTLKGTYTTGTGFPNNTYTQISSASVRNANQEWTKSTLASFFSRVDYNYKHKYYVEASIRADGSSKFGENNRWGYFPSVGASWRIKQENFMQNVKPVSDLKVRTSYGILGNQNGINNFAAQGLWTGGANYPNTPGTADQPGTTPLQLANKNLRWEKTQQLDFGIDIAFFNNRIALTTDFYYKRTTDLLLPTQVPATTGFTTYLTNSGEISNKGIEIAIQTQNIKSKKFSWNTSFNFTRNVNKVEKLENPYVYGSRDMVRNEEGYALYSFWMYNQLYVDKQTGQAVFEDVNGDGQITVADRKIMGNANPKFFGGLTNTFKYAGFDLNVFFVYQYGNKVVSFDRILNEGGGTKDNNRGIFEYNMNRWQKPGDDTDVPRVTSVGNNYGIEQNSRFLEDGSFIRLKTLTLGYTVPVDFTKKYSVQSVRFFVTGTNLLLFTKYKGPDPEAVHTSEQNARGIDVGTPPQPVSVQGGLTITL
ncbi:SusC/RagA family TonB-linked outer membrane protein [Cytophaga hutchinsonii]|uniref:Outer membrane receptor ragA protein n=1 Tax=Cytophaga hutchinsonii (strain ATCC 33406 / DSM 1761 / CIP 103989 / NBRC 15051 / NCIMB 9469 / D465) TaxID=269798 RepID=A0A6N4SNK5_CYTH3|nr:TonB-dependent receptor [Cytophaga hutchinsonii]ABG57833.1 outer membrane receptor; ragA protein [Cytophaga hutchinsonii ATCC 33406]SFX06816.1 TonB-linked outer membrane protein, SusC/RagA family [Cytophaga hutchinsonii ATCC 33406]